MMDFPDFVFLLVPRDKRFLTHANVRYSYKTRPTRCTNFANLFLAWNSTCFVQCLCPFIGLHSLNIQHWYMSYRFVDSFRAGPGWNSMEFHPGPAQKLSTNMYDIYQCWMFSEWTPINRQRHCTKHVEFHAKNKFAKLVHLVGLIIKKFVTMRGHMNGQKKKKATHSVISDGNPVAMLSYYVLILSKGVWVNSMEREW